MPQEHRLQQQRFELKYVINEAMAPGIRDFVSAHLELDDYGVGKPGLAYDIHSLYLDSEDLLTHRAVINGTKNRFKLRCRYYDMLPDSPVFLEVKERVDNCILKRRCPVHRFAMPLLLAGHMAEPDHLLSPQPRHLAAAHYFNLLQLRMNATPRLHNSYSREAWVSAHDNSVRVTFDRQIRAEPYFGDRPVWQMTRGMDVFPGVTVLEIKFTTRFPDWLRDLVQYFNLMQASSAKYSGGVDTIGEFRFGGNTGFDLGAQVEMGRVFRETEAF